MTDSTCFVSATPVRASLDIERSAAFYCTRLGFAGVQVQQGTYGIVSRGAVQLHFWSCAERHIAEHTSCRVRVEGIEALFAQCSACGIALPLPVEAANGRSIRLLERLGIREAQGQAWQGHELAPSEPLFVR